MTNFQVPNTYFVNLNDFAERRGIAEDALYKNTGISPQEARQLSGSVPFDHFKRVMQQAERLSRDPLYGLSMGSQLTPTSHGNLGFAVLSSKDLEQAIEVITRYSRTRTNLVSLHFRKAGTLCFIDVKEATLLEDIRGPIIDAVTATLNQAFKLVTGGEFRFNQLQLSRPAPNNLARYQSVFPETVIKFNSGSTELSFNASLLKTPNQLADPYAAKHAQQACEEALKAIDGEIPLSIQIKTRLLQSKGQFPTLEQVAGELHLSERTLRRRLTDEGEKFQILLQETRRELAEQYLKESNRGIHEIADLLGYHDPSNFGNAFKRWTGKSPKAYREDQGRDLDQPR